MLAFSAQEIARASGGKLICGDPEALATSCVIDSRTVQPDSLFVAFKGEHSDGNDYIDAAIAAGATVILSGAQNTDKVSSGASRTAVIQVNDTLVALQNLARYQRSLLEIPVIGITGSSGKTSTKEMIKAALGTALRVVATEANNNNELGVPLTVLSADETSEALVVEMGMRARGEIALLAEIARPQIGVITTIGDAHIELLGSRENIARAKAELLEALPADGEAIVPANTAYADVLRSVCQTPITRVGLAPDQADIVASDITLDEQAFPHARVSLPDGKTLTLNLSLPGAHNMSNALLAIATGLCLNLEPLAMADALATLTPSGMRFTVIRLPQLNIRVINDSYNANPESTAAALTTFAAMQTIGKRIAVLGDMLELGTESAQAHQSILGLTKELGINHALTYGDHYQAAGQRSGGNSEHSAGAKAEGRGEQTNRGREEYPHFSASDAGMDALLQNLIDCIEPGDLVLVKGSRGMRTERVVDALIELDKRSPEC